MLDSPTTQASPVHSTGNAAPRGEEAVMRIARIMLVAGMLSVLVVGDARAVEGVPIAGRGHAVACNIDSMDVNDPLFGPSVTGPDDVVWRMLIMFAEESAADYVSWMTDDFLFLSNDPDFAARFPCGMSRADEDSFSTHLFEGGGRGPGGELLPTASRIVLDAGPMNPSNTLVKGGEASVRVDWCHVRAMLSNGDTLDFGHTQSDFDLVLTNLGWRVRRWIETVLPASSPARRLEEPATSPPGDRPLALTLQGHGQPRRGVLRFDLVLPEAGGAFEIFDVMGRRIARRDLSELPPGRHTIALDGGAIPRGVYWARVRQSQATAMAKVIWVK
jgi:hypothetical protein